MNLTYSIKKEKEEKKRKSLGRFILGTNDVKGEYHKPEEILDLYKSQQNIERGFGFLKDPYFMLDPLYLKKTERINSLLMIMTLTLFVYNYGQHKLRTNMEKDNITLPDQKKKENKNITLKWAFQLMTGISVLLVKTSKKERRIVTKINPIQKKIINLLCDKDEYIYNLNLSKIDSS